MNKSTEGYAKDYSDEGFWKKVGEFAKKAGLEVVEKALQGYYALQDSDTPAWAKGVLIGALGYFISPVDAIPDIVPFVGYADDLGVLVAAVATVATHIKEIHKEKTKETLTKWF